MTPKGDRVAALIDYGDVVRSSLLFDPAIAIAYLGLDRADPLAAAKTFLAGYQGALELTPDERRLLATAAFARLAFSVTSSARQRMQQPDEPYLGVTEPAAWRLSRARFPGRGPRLGRGPGTGGDPDMNKAETHALRRRHLGPSLSLSYREPLKIVRGQGAWLYDEDGRAYLDCVNNVCHVGHSHPRVVAAAAEQMARLNTNTRYLHDGIVRYAERLAATLPQALEVGYFVCSGSEANELALRLVRAATGRRGVVVLEGAYHGSTGSLVELSPYKFEGRGGFPRPAHVQVAQAPDPYRGPHRDPATAGADYAEDVRRAFRSAETQGHPAAALFAESILSCAGQVHPPPGYLAAAYTQARAAGALAVADEVQVGFGRVGSHFWAFERQEAVPDVVTLGKPIGNGHPMAAVFTTRAVAEAFDNGMEYFSTFGGNPVSAAVGNAVLDVIEDEGLQANALHMGERLLEGLRSLAHQHTWIGDVRGAGLFLGIELVRDRETREPADAEAAQLVEAAKNEGVLLSTDGPLHNVLKIKPPLVFSEREVERLLDVLDRALAALSAAN